MKTKLAGFAVTLLLTGSLHAAPGVQDIIHVAKTGSDAAGCGSEGSPCATPQFADQYLDGGASREQPDVMYIHTGTYTVNGVANYNTPTIVAGGDHCTITAFGTDSVVLDGGEAPTDFVIGAMSRRNITISNLKIKGVPTFRNCPGLIFENNEVYEGITTDPQLGTWCHLFFMENCSSSVVRNNLFRDLKENGGIRDAIVHYGASFSSDSPENTRFEYNTFSHTGGIFLKHNPEAISIHHNYFEDIKGSALRSSNQAGPAHDIYFYSNVVTRSGNTAGEEPAILGMIEVTGFHMYNNTFIDNPGEDFWSKWSQDLKWDFFNNVSINNHRFFSMGYHSGATPSIQMTCTYLDYNAYSGSALWSDKCGSSRTITRATLAEWQTYLATVAVANVTDDHSIGTNPQLVKSSAITSALDARLTATTPAQIKTGGRGGSYPAYRGAWDPENSMYIGFCSQGIGNCDVAGDTSNHSTSVATPSHFKSLPAAGMISNLRVSSKGLELLLRTSGRGKIDGGVYGINGRKIAETRTMDTNNPRYDHAQYAQ